MVATMQPPVRGPRSERTARVAETPDAAGAAALSICESMLLCLVDLRILRAADVAGLLDDAAQAHRATGLPPGQAARGAAAAGLIETIAAGGNAVRRRPRGPAPDGGLQ